jgi:hypothetical protein
MHTNNYVLSPVTGMRADGSTHEMGDGRLGLGAEEPAQEDPFEQFRKAKAASFRR